MIHHHLKSYPTLFQAVIDRKRLFEIRRNDRDYKAGDIVTLHEYKFDDGDIYTGRTISARIGHVDTYAQMDGYVVFSLLDLGLIVIG